MSKESTSHLLSQLDTEGAQDTADVARIIEASGPSIFGPFGPLASAVFSMIGEAARLTVETQDLIKASEAEDIGEIG